MRLLFQRLALNVRVVCLLCSYYTLQCASLSLQGAVSLGGCGCCMLLETLGFLNKGLYPPHLSLQVQARGCHVFVCSLSCLMCKKHLPI